jgi:transposase
VVDHETGQLVWAEAGRSRATVHAFVGALRPGRSVQLTHVSAHGAAVDRRPVRQHAPQAVLCADPFRVVGCATEALADCCPAAARAITRWA